MPVYEYKCEAGHKFEAVLPVARYNEPQMCPQCGKSSAKLLSAPAVRGDFAPYSCPITGKIIDGRKAHEENLKRHGCRVLEPGETSAATVRRKQSDEQLEEKIADTAAELVSAMDTTTREQLGREIESGLDIAVVRQ
jgi:putative FmdB family regulatory protein